MEKSFSASQTNQVYLNMAKQELKLIQNIIWQQQRENQIMPLRRSHNLLKVLENQSVMIFLHWQAL